MVGRDVGVVVVFAVVIALVGCVWRAGASLNLSISFTYQSGWLYWFSLALSRATSVLEVSPVGAARVEAPRVRVEARMAEDFIVALRLRFVVMVFESLFV